MQISRRKAGHRAVDNRSMTRRAIVVIDTALGNIGGFDDRNRRRRAEATSCRRERAREQRPRHRLLAE